MTERTFLIHEQLLLTLLGLLGEAIHPTTQSKTIRNIETALSTLKEAPQNMPEDIRSHNVNG